MDSHGNRQLLRGQDRRRGLFRRCPRHAGDCTINADGSIGTPYAASKASEAPPCGITYLRATDGNPYQLKASVTWQGSDGTGGDLPNGTFETTQDINVQEIQSVNR